jgi:hypothetical protein
MDITHVLTLVTLAGGGLAAAVATMWKSFHGELKDCKDDRTKLFAKTDELHKTISKISESVGEMRGRLGMTTERE